MSINMEKKKRKNSIQEKVESEEFVNKSSENFLQIILKIIKNIYNRFE